MTKNNPLWLCLGEYLKTKEEVKPCIYAKIYTQRVEMPLYAGSFKTKMVDELVIICTKTHKFVWKWVKECPHYQNTTLEQHL